MIKLIGQLIYFIKKELNWKERTIDAPKTFPIQRREPSADDDEKQLN